MIMQIILINIPAGIGMIKRGTQKLFTLTNNNNNNNISYELLEFNRKNLLNLISITDFYKKIKIKKKI